MTLQAPMAILVGVIAGFSPEHAADVGVRKDIFCLAQNIYHESRGESALGQRAVAWVTMNRVNDSRWGDTVCDVVFEASQFSWTRMKSKRTIRLHNEQDAQAWREAVATAYKVYFEMVADPTNGATYFFAQKVVKPAWSKKMRKAIRIGGHTFMRG